METGVRPFSVAAWSLYGAAKNVYGQDSTRTGESAASRLPQFLVVTLLVLVALVVTVVNVAPAALVANPAHAALIMLIALALVAVFAIVCCADNRILLTAECGHGRIWFFR